MNPDHDYRLIKSYLCFDYHLAQIPGDDYPYHVRITMKGELPTEANDMGGFAATSPQETWDLLERYEKIAQVLHLKACLMAS